MPEITETISQNYRHTQHRGRWAFDAASFLLATRIEALKVPGVRRLPNTRTFLLGGPDPDGKRREVARRLNGGGR